MQSDSKIQPSFRSGLFFLRLLGAALLFYFAALGPRANAADGAPVWTNRFNGLGNADDKATALALDASGNVFVTGYSYASGGVNSDYATLAYSNAGVPLWTNLYDGTGSNWDYAYAIAVGQSGNIFVTGGSFGTGAGNDFDYATVAYSAAGVPLWTN